MILRVFAEGCDLCEEWSRVHPDMTSGGWFIIPSFSFQISGESCYQNIQFAVSSSFVYCIFAPSLDPVVAGTCTPMDNASISKKSHSTDEKETQEINKPVEFREGGFAGWGTVVGAYATTSFANAIPCLILSVDSSSSFVVSGEFNLFFNRTNPRFCSW